jgi:hypothetical protein
LKDTGIALWSLLLSWLDERRCGGKGADYRPCYYCLGSTAGLVAAKEQARCWLLFCPLSGWWEYWKGLALTKARQTNEGNTEKRVITNC